MITKLMYLITFLPMIIILGGLEILDFTLLHLENLDDDLGLRFFPKVFGEEVWPASLSLDLKFFMQGAFKDAYYPLPAFSSWDEPNSSED